MVDLRVAERGTGTREERRPRDVRKRLEGVAGDDQLDCHLLPVAEFQ